MSTIGVGRSGRVCAPGDKLREPAVHKPILGLFSSSPLVNDKIDYSDLEMNPELLDCPRGKFLDVSFRRSSRFVYPPKPIVEVYDESHWGSLPDDEDALTAWTKTWDDPDDSYYIAPYYQVYPAFKHGGKSFVWQAKAFRDGHDFLSSLRKYCLDHLHKNSNCLEILTRGARTVLNIYQGYYRALGRLHKYCKIRFLKHFVSEFSRNLVLYRKACKSCGRFVPHGTFMESLAAAREQNTWGASLVSLLNNWDVTSNFIRDSVSDYAATMATEYADRCSIVADILSAANRLYQSLIALKTNQCLISDVLLSINSFYRSLDFSNEWANKFKATLASIFPSFQDISDGASRVRDIVNYLIDGCTSQFKKLFGPVVDFVANLGGYAPVEREVAQEPEPYRRFFAFGGPLQPIIDICDSDLGFMASKLTALVAAFCALVTIDGRMPEISYDGLSEFAIKKVLPVVGVSIVAGKATGYLVDFDKVLSLMWQATDSIFKGDFGRFVGVDSYSQIFELYSFVSTSYGGVPPTQDTLSFAERNHYRSPVTKMLPCSIIKSSDPHWDRMIKDLEGTLAGCVTEPKNWSDGMKVTASYLNAKLQYMVGKVNISPEMKTKFTSLNTHLQSLTRNVCTAPSPNKASGVSFIFTGNAGIGKSNALGDTFITTVTGLIHGIARDYGYPDIGSWQKGDRVDPNCIDRQRRGNFMVNRIGGVSHMYAYSEDFDPCPHGDVPPENNLLQRIMMTSDTVSPNTDAPALESKKGDGVKGDNHFRVIAGFYSDNRNDAGLQDLAVHFPAAVRRCCFIEWHLKDQYADTAGKLNLEDPTVKSARNASDTSSLYNTVSVYTFVRLASAKDQGEYKKGEGMQRVPVNYTFQEDQHYGAGKEASFFKKGDQIVLSRISINDFYCYIHDFVTAKYQASFRAWRASEVKSKLKSEAGRCSCNNNISIRHCPVCAGLHEFNPYTGNLVVLCPRIRNPNSINIDPSCYGTFEKRSILNSLRKIDDSVAKLFPILVQSATLRPVTQKIFKALPVVEMLRAHSNGDRWKFAESGGAFIESASLDYILKNSAGVIHASAACLEDWWKDNFPCEFTLAQMYFFLVRYLLITPSLHDKMEEENNMQIISRLDNSTLKVFWQASHASGVDSNGIRLRDRIAGNQNPHAMNSPRDVEDMNIAKATFVSLTKCLIFDSLINDPYKLSDSHFDFISDDFGEITNSFFSAFHVTPKDYFKDFLSSFVPGSMSDAFYDHTPFMVTRRRDMGWNHYQVASKVFKDDFWEFDFDDRSSPGEFISRGSSPDEGSSDINDTVGIEMVQLPNDSAETEDDLKSETSETSASSVKIVSDQKEDDLKSETSEASVSSVKIVSDEVSEPTPGTLPPWVGCCNLDCCKGVRVHLPDGTHETYHHPNCPRIGKGCLKVMLHLGRSPSADDFVTTPTELDWDETVEKSFKDSTDFDTRDWISDTEAPDTCDPRLWKASGGFPLPVLAPSRTGVMLRNYAFSEFLLDLRQVVRDSCFVHIPKITTKAILYALAPVVAVGAFYPIFYKILSAGGDDDEGEFIPHGLHSDIPDGENYWVGSSANKKFSAKEVHNMNNTHKTSHGRGAADLVSDMFGLNKKCTLSRVAKLSSRDQKLSTRVLRMHGICYDSNSLLMPSHYFAQVDLEKGIDMTMELTTTARDGVDPASYKYEFRVHSGNICFDPQADMCMIAHGLSGIRLKPLDTYYKSGFYCSVNVDGQYWCPAKSGFKSFNDDFCNDTDVATFFGKDAVDYPDADRIPQHLRGKPMDGILVRQIKDKDEHIRKNGECGLPVIFSAKGKFPVFGFYIGSYHFDSKFVSYECYVPLTKRFVDYAFRALHNLSLPGTVPAKTIGAFKKRDRGFITHMDHVIEHDLDDPIVDEVLQESKRVSASNVRRTSDHVKWADFLSGAEDGYNVATDTDLFHFSGSKSGTHVSLPTFDTAKVKGIYPHHPGVRGMHPIIGSPNDVFFYPDFLYLGASPWAGETPHDTFSGELPIGMVGPGVESATGSSSSMSLDKEVAKCMVHGHIDQAIVKDASSRVYEHYFDIIEGIFADDNSQEDTPVHDDVKRLLHTTLEEQFVGVKRDNGTVIVPKMDHTSSWGSNNKPPSGSGKRDVYEISEHDELLVYEAAVPAWEAFSAAVYCFTCGHVPENQVTTCFTKRECYPVTMSSLKYEYPEADDSLDFYTDLIGEEKAQELLDCGPDEDQKIRDIFHSVHDSKVKIKSRLVSNLPGSVNVAFRMFLLPLAYLFSNFPIEFDMVAGLDMGSCHFEQSTNQIFFDGYDEQTDRFFVFDADVSAWDKIMPANLTKHSLMICIELVLVIHEYFGTLNDRLRAYADALLEWWEEMSLFYGGVILPFSVMPSGFIFTLPLNSLMNQVLKVCNILKFAMDHGIPFPRKYTDWVRHKALGDDSQTAIKAAFVAACRKANISIYSAINYSEIMLSFGITSTMGDKSETSLEFQDPSKLVFLQHVMFYLEIPAYNHDEILEDPTRANKFVLVGAAPLKASVLVKILAKQDSSSSVEKHDLLKDQVYIILGELVPYGKKRWQKFVDAVSKYHHPLWKPVSMDIEYRQFFNWNFWLDRYVRKFCRHGSLEKHILEQRSKNAKAFESLKKHLNPSGIERLEYDLESL